MRFGGLWGVPALGTVCSLPEKEMRRTRSLLVLSLVCIVALWGLLRLGDRVIQDERAEGIRLRKERDSGEGKWADYPLVQKLKRMEGQYPTPANPISKWTRKQAVAACVKTGRLHRHRNQSPAGESLECNELAQGCVVREWYLSRR